MRRRTTFLKPISSISLTSMMDVTFNLLIAFMIVAPTLKHGIELDLPEVEATNLKPKDSLTVVIRKAPQGGEDERIYLNDRRVSLNDLTERITALYERKPDIDVLVEADKTVPYETFARVLNSIRKAGVDNIGLVTEPPSTR
jgi:biopolymer transport protein TolR